MARRRPVDLVEATRLARSFTAQLISTRAFHLSALDAEAFNRTMDVITKSLLDAWVDGYIRGRE